MSLERSYDSACLDIEVDEGDDTRPELSDDERRLQDRRTPRIGFQEYSRSAFVYMYKKRNDQGLLNCCDFDHKAFQQLLDIFAPAFNTHTFDVKTDKIRKIAMTPSGQPKGRKRDIDAAGCLGLVLYWYKTQGDVPMAMIFGYTVTPLYKWLKFSRRLLLYVLQYHPSARIKAPSSSEIEKYSLTIAEKYPILLDHKVWGAVGVLKLRLDVDELKLALARSNSQLVQDHFYNRFTRDTYVNNMFVFSPDGRIRICTLNAPGCWQDCTVADNGMYEEMEKVYNNNGGKVVELTFNLEQKPYLLQNSKKNPKLNRAAKSVKHMCTRRMRYIKAKFPRLKDEMTLEDFDERKVIIKLMTLLYNFQLEK